MKFREAINNYEEEQGRGVIFDFEKCQPMLDSGRHYEPGMGELILDTGDFEVKNFENPYEETIAAGVIDHHRIDNLLKSCKDFKPKCSTQIVVDFKDQVLKMIEARRVSKTFSHSDADLDAIASSYLVQSLIQTKELPLNVKSLAAHVNKVDYGMYREADVNKYLQSLQGIFSAIKKTILTDRKEKKAIDEELSRVMFGIFNNTKDEFDYEKDMNLIEEKLPNDIRVLIKRGKEIVKNEFEVFEEDFKKAQKSFAKIKPTKDTTIIEAPMVISLESRLSSLDFINLAYQKTDPNAIIVVYAGPERKEGYAYNIGIKPEAIKSIDLGDICVALNRAEKQKRDQLSDNDEILRNIKSLPDRISMSGPEQIITKDPAVIVGGGSLISSPKNSLLSKEEFYKAISIIVKPIF